jgi:hypothetical protein
MSGENDNLLFSTTTKFALRDEVILLKRMSIGGGMRISDFTALGLMDEASLKCYSGSIFVRRLIGPSENPEYR